MVMRVLSVLFGWWCVCFGAFAVTPEELLQNLNGRIIPLPHQEGALIKSFTHHTQSYIYDQALAIISFSKAHEKNKARSLLLGLKSLQSKDGSLYFSYNLDGTSPYPQEGDKRFAGAIAWVAMAASHYQHAFKTKEFASFNYKLLTYLNSQMVPFEVSGKKVSGVKFAPHDVKASAWNEAETIALEHNLDAYAAFKSFSKLNNTRMWETQIVGLHSFIMSMWDSSRSHFWSGANAKTGMINKNELYLDNQSWSLLALDRSSWKDINPKDALDLNCEAFFVNHENIKGFMDSKPTRRPASSKFVWSEGTLGQILAMKEFKLTCNDHTSDEIVESIKKMKHKDGGIAYATSTPNPDFTTASSVAGTAWLYFALKDFNPFKI